MDRELLEKYANEGLSYNKIAKKMGKSQTNTIHWMKKYGLTTKPQDKPYLCKHCGETDPAKFYVAKNGKKQKSNCKDCHNANLNKDNQEKRIKIIKYKGGKCQICGYDLLTGSSSALVLHHINPKQKDPNYKTARGWTWERYKKEADKCALLCCRCHAEEHDLNFLQKHNIPQNRWLF